MTKDKTYREELVSLAYKIVPLPSGCSNCWGDLGEGCTDECRRSSDEHSKKINETVQAIQEHIEGKVLEGRIDENQRYIDLADEFNNRKPEPGELTAESFGRAGAGFIAQSYYESFKNRIKQLKDKGGSDKKLDNYYPRIGQSIKKGEVNLDE